MHNCTVCKSKLTYDDIGAYKKFVNRGAEEFMCIPCLAVKLQVDKALIYEKIEQFKKMGCQLF